MDSFYTTILISASIILILMLTYVGVLLYFAKSDEVYPPYQNKCPDYWAITSDGKCLLPPAATNRNRGTLGGTSGTAIPAFTTDALANTPGAVQYVPVTAATPSTPAIPSTPASIDFSNAGWKSKFGKSTELCNKKYWAETYGIQWDGVTNTNQC